MKNQEELIQLAKALPFEERKRILISFEETDLHFHLKDLLGRMENNNLIEITHGSQEHGNDLVMVKKDLFGESVVGIIVKSGDIKGKTMGHIDAIKSQVDQSQVHPIRLKTIPERILIVSEIWIMIAGSLSNYAHERLEREVIKKSVNIRNFGIDWLVENFTNFYPQAFYEGKLMDFLAEKITLLETSDHMFASRHKNLSECFVEPMISKIGVHGEIEGKFLIREQRFPFHKLNDILRPGAKVILFGDPGVGKSVALNKYMLDKLREAWYSATKKELPKQIEIPIKISSSEFLKISGHEDVIKQYILTYPEIYNRLKVTVLIIDGLDEILSTQRDELIEKAKKFSTELNCGLLISTRKTDLIKNPPIGFERYELLPFSYDQAVRLYEKLTFDIQILNALRDGLETIRYQVPMTPLSLFLLLTIVEARKEVPASITELYDQFNDIILGRYDIEKGIMVIFEYLIKKRFLAELAFKEFVEKKRLEMPEEEFNSFLNNYAHLYGWNEELLKKFAWEIGRAGILDFKKAISFTHGSFIDFFGAYYIWDNREDRNKFKDLDDFIARIYFEDSWKDVAFFYIGLQRKIDVSMLNKIFEFPKENFETHARKFMTGRLLQAGWHSTADTKYQGIQKAMAYATILRKEFSKKLDENEKPVPRIIPDFIVMILSDLSFGSRTLLQKGEDFFNVLAKQPSYENAYIMLSLLWAFQRVQNQNNIQNSITSILEVIDKIPEQNLEERATILSFLFLIEQTDKSIERALKRKIIRIVEKNPEVIKQILGPDKRKGFRKKTD